MATMKVLFKAVDEISAKFDSMTRSGERALESFESAGTAADGSLGRASATAHRRRGASKRRQTLPTT